MKQIADFMSSVPGQQIIMVVGSILGLITICGLQAYAVIFKNQTFDAVSFGTGFSAWVAGSCGGVGLHSYLNAGPVGQGGPSQC